MHGNVHPGSGLHGNMHPESVFHGDEEYDSGTDSDTVSSCGDRNYDYSDISNLPEEQQQQELFWAQEHAKGRWRQFMRKPVRRVRRFSARPSSAKEREKANDSLEKVSLHTP